MTKSVRIALAALVLATATVTPATAATTTTAAAGTSVSATGTTLKLVSAAPYGLCQRWPRLCGMVAGPNAPHTA